MIIKDEENLEELLTYYWIHGVEHFYIYDNDSNIPIKNRLTQFLFKKICTVIDFSGIDQQLNAYNHCLKNYGKNTNWLFIIDGDEYILPKKHKTLRDFLFDYNDYHAIGINWVFFGTSFHDKKQNGFIINNYRYTSNKQDKHIKTVCKPKYVKECKNPHFVDLYDPSKYVDPMKNIINGPFNEISGNTNIIQINHYYTRSIEESYKKENRGSADTTNYYKIPHSHDLYNDIKDNTIADKYLELLIKMYDIINTNWEIYKALNKDLELTLTEPNEYYEHIFKNGINEKRPFKITDIYPKFSKDFYRKNNYDLMNLSDLELEIHYINHGYEENRLCYEKKKNNKKNKKCDTIYETNDLISFDIFEENNEYKNTFEKNTFKQSTFEQNTFEKNAFDENTFEKNTFEKNTFDESTYDKKLSYNNDLSIDLNIIKNNDSYKEYLNNMMLKYIEKEEEKILKAIEDQTKKRINLLKKEIEKLREKVLNNII